VPDSCTFTARWVFPVSGPPLDRGTVTIRGETIEAVEPGGMRRSDEDLGNVAIIPGLVNAHTHLDLSGARGLIPPTDPEHFTDWLRGVIAYRRSRSPEDTQADVRAGLAECLQYGTTLVGDIAAEGASWDALAAAQVRAVVFREQIGLSRERAKQTYREAAEWVRTRPPSATCRAGLSPHSPYSANSGLLTEFDLEPPVAIHLAESPGELELLSSRSGPFVQFLEELGAWDPTGLVANLHRVLIWSRSANHVLFIHCNYLPHDLCRPIAGLHTIVYCPRTHSAFGHPPHPFREFLFGRTKQSFRVLAVNPVRVCLGTDSLASNPDLDLLAEARFVHSRYPDFPGDALLRMVTLSGAEALGWADETGSLQVGKSADLVAVPLPDADGDPYTLLFTGDEPDAPRRTMFRGVWRD